MSQVFCQSCSAVLPGEANFCPACGREVQAPPSRPPFPAPAASPLVAAAPPLLASPDGWVYRSASGLALAITILGGAGAALAGVAALVGFSVETEDEWDTVDAALAWLGFSTMAAIPAVILLIAWTRRITGNLKPFGTTLELGTGWAVGAFFVPIIMFIFPVRLWNQAWRATTPSLAPPVGLAWKGLPGNHLHWIVQVTYLAAIIVARWSPDTTYWTAIDAGNYMGVLGGLVAASLVMFIIIVRSLTARQDAYAARWAPASPPRQASPLPEWPRQPGT